MSGSGGKESAGTVAIVGASADPTKHGHRAVLAYHRQGWTVYPINPSRAGHTIDGATVLASLTELKALGVHINRVSLYLPPTLGRAALPEIHALGADEFFVNPGAEDDALMAACENIGLDAIYACSVVDIGERP